MSLKEDYQQKIDNDMKRVQRTLDAFKTQSESLTASDRIRYNRWIEELQKKAEAARDKLHAGKAGRR